MATQITLSADVREETGTGAARRMRRAGRVPAALNTEDGSTEMLSLDAHDFGLVMHRHMSESLMVDLVVQGAAPRRALLKQIQHGRVDGEVIHVDFLEVSMTKVMRVQVPLRLVGDPVGVTRDGGLLEHPVRELEVECLPSDFVEELLVDVSGLSVGEGLRVSDLEISPKLTVLTAADVAVASVSAPRIADEEDEEAEGAEGAEGAGPEVADGGAAGAAETTAEKKSE